MSAVIPVTGTDVRGAGVLVPEIRSTGAVALLSADETANSVPSGANASWPLPNPGSVVYTTTVGFALAGFCTRHSDASWIPPTQLSSKKRSPDKGSTARPLGQEYPDATVRTIAPVVGSTCTTDAGLNVVP